jgi:glutamate/aspartate transport system substrate-binding protein
MSGDQRILEGSSRLRLAVTVGVAVLLLAAGAAAEERACTAPLCIGVLRDSPPFSFIDRTREPRAANATGYSVELCTAFAETHHAKVEGPSYELVLVEPTSRRFDMLEAGHIDLLCGATTATLALRADFAVSIYTFVTVQGFVRLDPPSPAGEDPRVGFLPATTADQQLDQTIQLLEAGRLPVALARGTPRPVEVTSHYDAIDKLRNGDIDIYIADRAILSRLIALTTEPGSGEIVLEDIPQRLEPYALVLRRDDPRIFALNRHLRDLFQNSQKLADVLARHFPGRQQLDKTFFDLIRFQARLPDGERRPAR